MHIARGVAAVVSGSLGLVPLLPLMLLTAPFWAVSAMTRLFHRFLRPRTSSWKDLIQYEPVVGWRARPNLDTRAIAGDTFHLTTDSDGWRGKETLDDADVVVFGDSFAFGYGVDDDMMYSRQVPGVRIKAIGINGYNLVQSLFWMERYAARLEGKLVIWLIYHGNDLYENLRPHLDQYRMPFVRQKAEGGWEIVTDHIRADRWIHTRERKYLARLAEICSGGFLSERAFGACDYLIHRASVVCQEAGATLAIVTAPELSQVGAPEIARLKSRSPSPETFDPDLPDQRIAAICRSIGVEFVPLKNHLDPSDFNLRDVHWVHSGHRRFGDAIGMMYRKHISLRSVRKGSKQRVRLEIEVAGSPGAAAAETVDTPRATPVEAGSR